MIKLSKKDLEQIADRVFRAYRKLLGADGIYCYSVDPTVVCESVLGLEIYYRNLSECGNVLGATAFGQVNYPVVGEDGAVYDFPLDGKSVLIDQSLLLPDQEGRRNFTIAHEAGHHILHLLYPTHYPSSSPLEQTASLQKDVNWEEWQCDQLASFLLMPECVVRSALALFDLDRFDCLRILSTRDDYDNIGMVADFLGVSKQALIIRLKGMGIIEKVERGRTWEIEVSDNTI